MKVINLNLLNRLDHEDVKEQAGSSDAHRRKCRLSIIKNFMKWQSKNKDIIAQNKADESAILAQRNHKRMLLCFGAVANFFMYQAFLTGTYNYRNTELIRMRRVPFVLKFSISTLASSYMYYTLH
jgi:hypothetical protein